MNETPDKTSTGATAFRSGHFLKDTERVLAVVLPVCVSVGLVLWLLHKIDLSEVWRIVRHGCNYRWLLVMMLITMLSHMIRGIRWGIQLRGVGVPRMTVTAESVSIFGAYALNLVLPQLGEVWRCVYVSRRERVPLSTVAGTDIGDRMSDLVVVLLLLGLAMIVAHGPIETFLQRYALGREVVDFGDNPWMWCAIAAVVGIFMAVLRFGRRLKVVEDIDTAMKRVWQGFKVLFTMRGKGIYVVLTLGIWTCYFMETYVCFQAFPFTRALVDTPGTAYGLVPGLVVFVFGSMSMAVPSNGGLGPWNLAVMFALELYGVSESSAVAYSVAVWSCQTIMLIMLGIFSAIYIMHTRHFRKVAAQGSGPHT